MEKASLYKIIFNGLTEESPKAVQKLKATFMVDLDFPTDQIQKILDAAKPITIWESDHEKMAKKYHRALQKAGAKVLLVTPDGTEEGAQEEVLSEGEISLEDLLPAKDPVTKEEKVYHLDVDDLLFEDPATMEASAETESVETASTPAAHPFIKPPESPIELSFEEESSSSSSEAESPISLSVNPPLAEQKVTEQVASLLSLDEPEEKAAVEPPKVPVAPPPAPEQKPVAAQPTSTAPMSLDLELGADESSTSPKTESSWNKTEEIEDVVAPIAEEEFSLAPKKEAVASTTKVKEATPEPTPKAAPAPEQRLVSVIVQKSSAATEIPSQEAAPSAPGSISTEGSKRKGRKGRAEFLESSGGIFFVLILLFAAGNYFYVTMHEEPERPEIDVAKLLMASTPKKDKTPAVPTPIPLANLPMTKFSGNSGFSSPRGLTTATVKLIKRGSDVFEKLSITLNPPAPPQLTPEEIVQNKVRAPWVYKIEVEDAMITTGADGVLSFSAPTKISFEYRNQKKRLIGKAKGTLTAPNEQLVSKISLTIWNGAEIMPEVEIIPEVSMEGRLQLSLPLAFEFQLSEELQP